ncbi:MAG: transposase [Sandaracinaceae bacterium]|nr:transposase [Sandaracinaceae bacterium]
MDGVRRRRRRPRCYRRRRPERGALHATVQEELETFLASRRGPGADGVPRFVEKALRAFLRCGLLAYGIARFSCEACGDDRLVAFSCKARGLCPSCDGRRMTARAADLVDRVLPYVRHRQWVLSLPFWLRWRCAWDHDLARAVLRVFLRAVFAFQRRRARKRRVADGRCGAVTVIQRFGGALNLNVHFHSLVPDGAWTEAPDGQLTFHPLPAPTDDELEALTEQIAVRVKRLLVRRSLWIDDDDGGRPADTEEPPALADLYQTAVLGRDAERVGGGPRLRLEPGTQLGRERRTHGGFDLHAGVTVSARDRAALERLCRYLLRPALAQDRLERLPGGDVLLKLKTRWSDGTTHVRLTAQQLLERLSALIPRPRTSSTTACSPPTPSGERASSLGPRQHLVHPTTPTPPRTPPNDPRPPTTPGPSSCAAASPSTASSAPAAADIGSWP